METPFETPVTIEFSCTGSGIFYSRDTDPRSGQLSGISANFELYTPDAGDFGPDSFMVEAQDAWGGPTAYDTVSVTVDQPPGSEMSGSGPIAAQALGTSGPPVQYTVRNTGQGPLELGQAAVSGTDPDDFEITNDNCSYTEVDPDDSCTLDVRFGPSATGSRTATLAIDSNDPSGGPSVTLTATGTAGSGGPTGSTGPTGADGRIGPQGRPGREA